MLATAFAAAIDVLFADPNLGLDAVYRAGGADPGVPVRVILRLSTPYHSYFKNLVLAVSGKMDNHFTALWDGGHVKFFSVDTLGRLLREAGAKDVKFMRVGRVPILAKSMVAVVESSI